MGKTKINNISGVKKNPDLLENKDSSSNFVNGLTEKLRKLELENRKLREEVHQLKEIRQALNESNEKYQILLNTSVNTITIIRDGKIIYANPAFLKAFGYINSDDLVGKDFGSLLDPGDFGDLNKKLQRLEEGRSTETAQLKQIRKDGFRVIMEYTTIPIKHENQPAILFIGQNITPWKESEEALRESQQKLSAIFECAPDCILMTDLNHHIKLFNRPVHGYSVDQLLNSDFIELVTEEYHHQIDEYFSSVVKSIDTSGTEFILKNSQPVIWLSCRIALLNYGSHSAGFIITLTDISKQKESELRIIESEKRYISLVDNINSGVIILQTGSISSEFIVKDINKAALKIFSKKKAEVKKSNLINLLSEYGSNGVINVLEQVHKKGDPKFIRATYYQSEHFTGWLEHYFYKISGGEVIAVIEDVSEKYNATSELKKARKDWQDIFEAIGQPALILDKNRNIISANKAVMTLTGKSQEDLRHYKCYEIFHSNKNHSQDNCPLHSLLSSKDYKTKEIEIEALDGTYMVSCTPILDDTGSISKIIHIATDITDIKDAKNALSESLTRYQNLVDTIPYGISEIDIDGKIIFTNSALLKMLGYKPKELLGKTIYDLQISDEFRENTRMYYDEIRRHRCVPQPYVTKNLKSDGSQIDVQIDWNYLEDSDGKIIGFISVNSDITERLKADEELKAAKEKAEESDRLKSAFLSNMSHEIRTPLNGIIGFSTMLNEEKISPAKRMEYKDFIQRAANQLLNIINDLIDISKIESGQLSLHKKNVHIDQLLNELFEYYQEELKKNEKEHLELILQTPKGSKGYQIVSDEVRLRQVLINLLINALKFTEKGKIEFGYELLSDTTLKFFVKDTGIGIANQNLKIVFERFRQEDDSFRREFGGAGLGLAISKGIVDKMGGKIWVTSTKNKGSEFYFTIPLFEPVMKPLLGTIPADKYVWPDSSVLVVEDDPINVELIKATFKKSQAMVVYAKDGEEAIRIFSEKPDFDVVLLDIRLPYLDGYSVARQMRKINPAIKVIAYSAYAMEKDKTRAKDAGFDGYLTKPALPEEILEIVDRHLKKNQ